MIWCVEDDSGIREIEVYTLNSTGFEARGFSDGASFREALETETPELVLLDVMLPGEDGVSLLRYLRQMPRTREVPVIMATAKGMEYDKIQSLDMGADDYLVKPFQSSIFALKVKRMLSRSSHEQSVHTLQFSDIILNLDAYTCTVHEKAVELTPKEFALLRELMENIGRVLTREYLLEKIWGMDYVGDIRAVDTLIKKTRKKIGDKAPLIKTVISVGYKMEDSL